jgi:hypothetical protein
LGNFKGDQHMSNALTGIKAHDDVVNAAEGARQTAVAAASNQAGVKSAEVTYYRAVVKSALKNGCGVQPAMQALRELGVTGQ